MFTAGQQAHWHSRSTSLHSKPYTFDISYVRHIASLMVVRRGSWPAVDKQGSLRHCSTKMRLVCLADNYFSDYFSLQFFIKNRINYWNRTSSLTNTVHCLSMTIEWWILQRSQLSFKFKRENSTSWDEVSLKFLEGLQWWITVARSVVAIGRLSSGYYCLVYSIIQSTEWIFAG